MRDVDRPPRGSRRCPTTDTRARSRFSTGMPANRAPPALNPIAYSARPMTDRCSRTKYASEHRKKNRQLRRNHAPQISLTEREKRRRKSAVVHRCLGDAFRDAAKQRERAERHDQRRQPQPRNQHGVQPAAGAPDRERDGRRGWNRQCRSRHAAPKQTAASPIIGADRQVDAAGNQNRRQRNGEQSELGVEPRDLEEVARA